MSQLARGLFGRGGFYYLVQASTALILVLAANTAFADFPRLASLLARNRYVPRQLATWGDRLVFSNGILILAGLAIMLIAVFRGETHALIPLYAVGVFIAFTLSQTGMARHWLTERGPGWHWRLALNGAGGAVTAVVALVIAVTKFTHGAWIVVGADPPDRPGLPGHPHTLRDGRPGAVARLSPARRASHEGTRRPDPRSATCTWAW